MPTSKRYIGSTISFTRRKVDHERMLNQKSHHSKLMQEIWETSSDGDFEFYKLERCVHRKYLLEREQFWMDFFSSSIVGFNVLHIAGQLPWEDKMFSCFMGKNKGRRRNKKAKNINKKETAILKEERPKEKDSAQENRARKKLIRYIKNNPHTIQSRMCGAEK